MHYAQQYRTELLNALKGIDLSAVDRVVDILRDARAHGRCIFVCGNGTSAAACSHVLCELLRTSSLNRTMKFRVFALTDELRQPDLLDESVIVNQLRDTASPEDVVVGISTFENPRPVLRALEYAGHIGCRTVGLSGQATGRLASAVETSILMPDSDLGSVADAHMIVCRMIGNYFLNADQG